MKLLFDLLPVVVFFAAFKLYDIYVATVAAIVATALLLAWNWLRHRRVERMHLFTFAIVAVLGGATLLLQDEVFIKWKPTVVNWLFAAAFLASQWFSRRPLVERMLSANLQLPAPVWRRLNLAWVSFFLLMGAANLYVAFRYETAVWVDFKLFGLMGLTLVFVVAQAFYLARYLQPEGEQE